MKNMVYLSFFLDLITFFDQFQASKTTFSAGSLFIGQNSDAIVEVLQFNCPLSFIENDAL